ncbi:MAG: molecular chaperone TorD family protein [Armatimonadetes bacterium]|nr:molecular chaperone TorD family protein [Armatimonadota bacterium]MDW8153283.1 molecular chaperone TorD family protein [Armatimonadota bacterium]
MSTDCGAPRRLLARAVAYGACARLLAPWSGGAVPRDSVEWLDRSLAQLELTEGRARFRAFLEQVEQDPEAYRTEYARVFERGSVPPYAASYAAQASPALGGPNLQQIADIAGFYRAFGFEARGDRPDHLAAQLEFLAFVCTQEACACLVGREEDAEVCSQARRSFLREHVSSWLPALATRVRQASSHPGLHQLVALVDLLCKSDEAEPTS